MFRTETFFGVKQTYMKMRRTLSVVGGLLAGIVVYYGVGFLLVFLVTDVLGISVSSADFRSLVIIVIWKVVPLIWAMLTAVLIMHVSRRKAN